MGAVYKVQDVNLGRAKPAIGRRGGDETIGLDALVLVDAGECAQVERRKRNQ